MSPDGIPLWVSDARPGSTHDINAARELVGPARPAALAENRGFALLKERWHALEHLTVSPTSIGDIAKAALVLTQFEHKMIG